MSTGDVENGKRGVDLSGLPRDFPTVDFTQQADIGHKRAKFAFVSLSRVTASSPEGAIAGSKSPSLGALFNDT